DNVPILSWLWLRARCRDCAAPISARYPLVELAVGLLFLALGWTDWVHPQTLALAAANQAAPNGPALDFDLHIHSDEFLLHYLYLLLLLCPLLAAVMTTADKHNLPRKLIPFPSAAAIFMAVLWPFLQPLPLGWPVHAIKDHSWLLALITA